MKEKPSEWIAISDLMAGVLAVVVLMLVVVVVQNKVAQAAQEKATVMAVVQSRQAQAAQESTIRADAESYISMRMNGIREKMARAAPHSVDVRVDLANRSFRLDNDVLFGVGSAALSDQQVGQLAELARNIRGEFACSIPSLHGVERAGCSDKVPMLSVILIEGHADRQPFRANSKFLDNLELSTARAAVVFRSMSPMFEGLRNREGQTLLGAAGYGDLRPRSPLRVVSASLNSPEDRRIEVRLLFDSVR